MLLRLADEYHRRGYSQIVCLRKNGWLASEVKKRNISLLVEPLGCFPDVLWLYRMVKHIRFHGIGCIHSHEFAMNIHSAILGKCLGVPVVTTVHGKKYYGEKSSRRMAYRLAANSTNMVAVSKDIHRYLVKNLGIDSDKIKVIGNGVDTNLFKPDLSKP